MARVPFRARARTVDHLGREQIADCPTAVSELWKNAYDAYARTVGLHIFDGEIPVAAVVDDGHGMSADEFIERWLMLGTEAKAGDDEVSEADRDGLTVRPRQGQKGIGRLSVAYLGPTVLVLTKRSGGPFVAALIDWRLFQNPYLALDDVQVPVEEFTETDALPQVVSRLFDGLIDNIWGSSDDPQRSGRLEGAWNRFSQEEKARGEDCSRERIASLALGGTLEDRHVTAWPAWTGERDRGTALFVFDAVRELRVWIDPGLPNDDPEVKGVRDKLHDTLTGFVDPFNEGTVEFRYEVVAHAEAHPRSIVSSEEVFDIHNLRDLEHVVEGRFDETGLFSGHVRAWGKDRGQVAIAPFRPPPLKGRGYVGAFEICFGTFEQEAKNSKHPADVIGLLKEQAGRFGGLAVYRDGLRLQPYGRPEVDFFGMEERRSQHAGREFWSDRRTFGRVAITRKGNPYLRDKAGREGFIDNQGAREFRLLVVELLRSLARRFFGSDSEIRTTSTAETQAQYARAQDAEERAKGRRKTAFREALKANGVGLQRSLTEAREVLMTLEASADPEILEALALRLDALRVERAALALPPRPRTLKPISVEERYRTYRDGYIELTATLEQASARWTALAESSRREPPADTAQSALSRHQKLITDATGRWSRSIRNLLSTERARWLEKVATDNSRYYELASPLAQDVAEGRLALGVALSEMEALRERVFGDLVKDYEGYIRSLAALGEGIDLDEALGWAMDERSDLLDKVEQWQILAQLGITVEIIGHDLSENAAQVSRNLGRLPGAARETEAYKLASSGFRSLVQRLEFLAPLRLSGPRLREPISGGAIEKYLREFFERQITDRRIEFIVTPAFQSMSVIDYPHRVFPVFVNLVNNSLYWVTFGRERKILLDRVGSKVYVADSGPGVDPDDIPELFHKIFFTRRTGGHGVGLYLSRISLEQGRHHIRYADPDEGILPGANFIIEFQSLQDD